LEDPVWSKVIAFLIISLLTVLYGFIKSRVEGIALTVAFNELFAIKIRVVYVVLALIIYLIVKPLFSRKGKSLTKQQKEFIKSYYSLHNANGIRFKFNVYFEDDIPFVKDLTLYCTKHEIPVRFLDNSCPQHDCQNHGIMPSQDYNVNYIESILCAAWDKIK
jgi:hypothetical protein